MSIATQALPEYLKKYIVEQYYDKYTPEDHAVWRYIMRQNRSFFSKHGVPIYLEGLKKTGIVINRIPRIAEMDACLATFGWGAVPVIGFIPPAAFLEFQARAVLPIACDMRTLNHLAYTPAPDIVHEAAGHAPIVADPHYSNYLHRYARMAQKAIQSIDDIRVYEAIRHFSDVKENPDSKPEQIAVAEQHLKEVSAAVRFVSEGVQVARMAWWTVEYGLVGSLDDPQIYGAGLLSSVGESQTCLSTKVKKIPLTVECVKVSYDITEPQPQLFVAENMDHLSDILSEFEQTLAFVRGGEIGLSRAKEAETVTTAVLESGVSVSGVLTEYRKGETGEISFVKYLGPVQLAQNEIQLKNQGRERHGSGFSSPLGRWKKIPQKRPHLLTEIDLKAAGLNVGNRSRLELATGFVIEGIFLGATRSNNSLLLLTWNECSVRLGAEVLYQPDWGEFDQLVGETVTSVYGGPADSSHYGAWEMGKASTTPSRTSPFTEKELALHEIYRKTRIYREKGADQPRLEELTTTLLQKYPDEWLPALETLEVVLLKNSNGPSGELLRAHLEGLAARSEPTVKDLIHKGLTLAATPD